MSLCLGGDTKPRAWKLCSNYAREFCVPALSAALGNSMESSYQISDWCRTVYLLTGQSRIQFTQTLRNTPFINTSFAPRSSPISLPLLIRYPVLFSLSLPLHSLCLCDPFPSSSLPPSSNLNHYLHLLPPTTPSHESTTNDISKCWGLGRNKYII